MIKTNRITENTLVPIVGVAILFMLIMFSQEFGLIYIGMATVWFMFFVSDKLFDNKKISFPVEKSSKMRIESFLIALITYAIFLLLTSIISSLFSIEMAVNGASNSILDTIPSVIGYMGSWFVQATNPIYSASIFLMVIGWGVLIPIVETSLFNGKIFEFLYDKIKHHGLISLAVLCTIVGAIATLFHLTSKDAQSIPLMITFIFFTLSAVLVLKFGHLREAIFLHMIANTVAVVSAI